MAWPCVPTPSTPISRISPVVYRGTDAAAAQAFNDVNRALQRLGQNVGRLNNRLVRAHITGRDPDSGYMFAQEQLGLDGTWSGVNGGLSSEWEVRDTYDQLSGYKLTGVKAVNLDGNNLMYLATVLGAGLAVKFFKDPARATQIGHTAAVAAPGATAVIADGASGLGGTITVDSAVANDADIVVGFRRAREQNGYAQPLDDSHVQIQMELDETSGIDVPTFNVGAMYGENADGYGVYSPNKLWECLVDVTKTTTQQYVSNVDWRGYRFYCLVFYYDTAPGTPAAARAAAAVWPNDGTGSQFYFPDQCSGAADIKLYGPFTHSGTTYEVWLDLTASKGSLYVKVTAFAARMQIRFACYRGGNVNETHVTI